MDKGVKNNHLGHITVSAREEGESDVVLLPGLNRLNPDQYRQIRKVPVINNYFAPGVRLLEDATPPSWPAATAEEIIAGAQDSEPKSEGKPLEKMNKEELVAKAAELNIELAPEDTKAVILAKIQAAQAAAV